MSQVVKLRWLKTVSVSVSVYSHLFSQIMLIYNNGKKKKKNKGKVATCALGITLK